MRLKILDILLKLLRKKMFLLLSFIISIIICVFNCKFILLLVLLLTVVIAFLWITQGALLKHLEIHIKHNLNDEFYHEYLKIDLFDKKIYLWVLRVSSIIIFLILFALFLIFLSLYTTGLVNLEKDINQALSILGVSLGVLGVIGIILPVEILENKSISNVKRFYHLTSEFKGFLKNEISLENLGNQSIENVYSIIMNKQLLNRISEKMIEEFRGIENKFIILENEMKNIKKSVSVKTKKPNFLSKWFS